MLNATTNSTTKIGRMNYFYVELVTSDYFLATGIGLDSFKLSDNNGDKTFSLKGMLKYGIVYGDTILTNVEDKSELPKESSLFRLFQTINSTTNIQYAISRRKFTTLKVHNVLRKEVATLINENKSAGMCNFRLTIYQAVYIYIN